MAEQNKNTTLTGKGFAKVQFLSIANDVKNYLEKDYPIKFLYNKYFKEKKFTYSYPHFITLIKKYIGKSYCKNSSVDKNLIECFEKIENDITSHKMFKEDIINVLTKENNIKQEFPEVCKILSNILNDSKEALPSQSAAQKYDSCSVEQSSISFGKRPDGAKPKI